MQRLREERPDLAARVDAGEFTDVNGRRRRFTANAAAIEAGWRKKPTPFEQVRKLLPRMRGAKAERLGHVKALAMDEAISEAASEFRVDPKRILVQQIADA
jgi:hypothetical protein